MKKKKNSYSEIEPEELEETDETESDFEDEEASPKAGFFSKIFSSLFEEVEDDDEDEEDDEEDEDDENDEYYDVEDTEEEYDENDEEEEDYSDEEEIEPEENSSFQDFSENEELDIPLETTPELNLQEDFSDPDDSPEPPVLVFPDKQETDSFVVLADNPSDSAVPETTDELLLDAPEDMPEFREEAVPEFQSSSDADMHLDTGLTENLDQFFSSDTPDEERNLPLDDEEETVSEDDEEEEEEEEEDDEEELDENGRPKKTFLSIALPIAAVLVIALGFTYCLQLGLFNEKEVYYMPDLVGRNYYELGQDYNNFDIQVNRSDYSSYDKDIIYAQDIPPGTEVKLGQTVNIDLSLGYAVVPVPDVRNYQYAYAQKLLEQSGFETELVYEQSLNGTAADNVIRTLPASGEEANQGSKITLYVSQGLAADSAQVQTFTGMLLDDAVDLCEMYGLEVETVPVPALEAPNVVVEQSIEAGASVPFHTVITLAYSSGEQPQGTVPYQLNFPPYATGRFILDFIDIQGNVLASSDIIVAGFSAASTVPVQGTGSQEIKVVLNNCTTNMQAELGTYNFDFTTGTYTILNEDMQAAFEAVNGIAS